MKFNDYVTCVISDDSPEGFTVYEGKILGHVLSENLPDKHWCVQLENGRIVGLSCHRMKLSEYQYVLYVDAIRSFETYPLKSHAEYYVKHVLLNGENIDTMQLDKIYLFNFPYSQEKFSVVITKEKIHEQR